MKKFYKTTFTVRVLSEEPIPVEMELAEVMEAATNGSYIADPEQRTEQTLTPVEVVALLYAFGSEPGFFNLTDEGEEAEI